MYKKPDGSIGMSFTRFINNAVPNLAADPHRDDNKPALGQDMLYRHQLSGDWADAPFALSPTSFHVAGITDNETYSRKAYEKLTKSGTLNPLGRVDTRSIDGRKLANQLSFVPVARQKKLIEMLFWWEEEVRRLEKLVAEENYLNQHIEQLERSEASQEQQSIGRLKFEREKLRMRIKQRPSERRDDIEAGTDQLYAEAEAAGLSGTQSGAAQGLDEPPAYKVISRE